MSDIYRQDEIPEQANENDRWVDTDDEQKIYVCNESYSSNSVERSFTIPASDRPGSVPLVLKTVAPHAPSTFTIIDGGGSGSIARFGSGTIADPYDYIITLGAGALSTNDFVISLTAGQPLITAEGSDSTQGAVVAYPETALEADFESFWDLRNIHARFVAIPPTVNQVDTNFPGWIPPALRNILPEMVAIRLGASDGGGDLRRAQIWQARVNQAIGVAHAQMKSRTNTISGRRYF